MAVGFATLGGGDTVSFDLNTNQISAVQTALGNLSAGLGSDVSSVFGSVWANSTGFYDVYNLDGGTPVPWVPANTDAFVLDSISATTGSDLAGNYWRANLWVGNQGNDTFTIGAPSQTIYAGDGNNSIDLNSLQHGGGVDSISVGSGADTIRLLGDGTISALDTAGGGDSIYMQSNFGLAAANWILAGDGNDTITFIGTTGTVQAGGGNNTVDFTGDGEVSVGGGSDTITFAGSGSIYAGNGNDQILTTTNQTLYINVGNGADTITLNGGSGTVATTVIAGSGSDSLTLGSPTVWGEYDVILSGGNDTVTLGLGRATVSNSGGSTNLDATQSTDLNYTGFGTDSIQLGAGYDSVVENGAATVIGGSFLTPPSFTPQATVQGGTGTFLFVGHDGYDSVTAGSGAATLIAGSGNDTFHAGASSNALLDASTAGSGNDALYGGSGSATLLGGSGTDSFFGGSGNTTAIGGTGYSFFQGGAGSTSMVGGSSWNFFTGGSGSDTMVANTVPPAPGVDPNVFNFEATVGGSHEIQGYNSTAPGGDTSIHLTFTNYGLTASQIVADSSIVGGDTVITIPGGANPTTTITIKDYTGLASWNIDSK